MVLSAYVILFCAIWILVEIYLIWALHHIPQLAQVLSEVPVPVRWPTISIVIPACNEGEHIESALRSLLAQEYSQLEIIVIDDRSSDATGDIIDRLAAEDPRITPLHITALPDGWLGKVHALHQGVQLATGEWLLFTDADVHFKTDTLQHVIRYAQHAEADHVALLPSVVVDHFWLDVAVRSFGLLFLLTTRAAHVHRAGNNYYIGVGAFNLVRRSIFDRTPGFEWLRLEPGDDAALGMMIKQVGGRTRFALAYEELSVSWYPSLAAMFKGLEKNLFGPGAHYQWWRVVLQVGQAWALVAAPFVGVVAGLQGASVPGGVAAAITILVHFFFSIVIAEKPAVALRIVLFPLGLLLVNAMMVRAAYRCLRNNGIDWRGTHYPLPLLRAGQRIKF
jgi:hypothetical protein